MRLRVGDGDDFWVLRCGDDEDVLCLRSSKGDYTGNLSGGKGDDVLRLSCGDDDGVCAYYRGLVKITESGFIFSSWCTGIGLVIMAEGRSVVSM